MPTETSLKQVSNKMSKNYIYSITFHGNDFRRETIQKTLNNNHTVASISDFSFVGLSYHQVAINFWIKVGEEYPLFCYLNLKFKLD